MTIGDFNRKDDQPVKIVYVFAYFPRLLQCQQSSDTNEARFVDWMYPWLFRTKYLLFIHFQKERVELCFNNKMNKHNAELQRADPGTKVTG